MAIQPSTPYVPVTPPYAITRQLDPLTGDVFPQAGAWARGWPMVEIVLRTLRTPKRSIPINPTFGIELNGISVALPNAPAQYKTNAEAALGDYVKAGLISNVSVIASVIRNGPATQLTATVSFYDHLAGRQFNAIQVGRPFPS